MSDLNLPLNGQCLCGAVRVQVTERPEDVTYCHCTMCRRWSSGAMTITARFSGKAVSFTQGKPKVHRSSEKGRRGFCEECGTQLTFQYLVSDSGTGTDLVLDTEALYIPIGVFDDAEKLRPRSHYCVESQLSWLKIDDDLPRRRYGEI